MCSEHIDGATLHENYTNDSTAPSTHVGEWKHDGPVTGFTRWVLSSPSPPWSAKLPLQPLAEDVPYRLYGWTTDSSWSATGVSATPSQLADLEPGEVITFPDAVMTEADFRENICDRWG